jgi:hypothetical protein
MEQERKTVVEFFAFGMEVIISPFLRAGARAIVHIAAR